MQPVFLFWQLVALANVCYVQCGIIDPLDEFHNDSGINKILAGINDIAANVGKIGAKLFNNSIGDSIVKVKKYQKVWEFTTWSSVDEHEVHFHGVGEINNGSGVEEHEVKYHGKPKQSETLAEHEKQYHAGIDDTEHTGNLKEHEAKFHHNVNEPCGDLKEHEVKHHKRNISANVGEHERNYHKLINDPLVQHERVYHKLDGERASKTLQEHLDTYHRHEKQDCEKSQAELVREHEEKLHGESPCAYKRTCHFLTQNRSVLLWGCAALITLFLL